MDIYAALKSDHKQIKTLLKQLDDTTENSVKRRMLLLKKLKETLVPHARAEEKVLYDPLKKSPVKDADALAFEGYEEHTVVDRLLRTLEDTASNDKKWTALISVARKGLEHHIKEEEDDIFKKSKKSFEPAEVEEMAIRFLKLKRSYLADLKSGKLPQQPSSHELV